MLREADLASHSAEEPNRRDFIVIAAQAFAGVGAAVALWPFIQPDEPRRLHAGAGLHRGGPVAREGGPGHHRVVARQAGVHPQPHGRGGEGGQGRQAGRSEGRQRAQRRPARKRAGHRRQPHQEGQGELARAGRHLHASGLHSQGPVDGRRQGRLRRLVLPLPRLALRYRRAHPAGARAAQPRGAALRVRRPTPRSRSAEGAADGQPRIDLPADHPLRQVARRAAAAAAHDARAVRRFPDAAQHQLPVDHGRPADLLPGRADRHRHRAGHALRAERRPTPSTASSTSAAT